MSGSAARESNPARGEQPCGLLTEERRKRDAIRRKRSAAAGASPMLHREKLVHHFNDLTVPSFGWLL